MIQQDTIFEDIRRFSEQTALNTTFGQTDRELYWFALISCIIAFVAFIISIVALYYTIRTLKSQERTERNTRLIPKEERVMQLIKLADDLTENTARIIALMKKEEECGYKKHPADWHFKELKLSGNLLTTDSFWEKLSISQKIMGFNQAINNYNASIDKMQAIIDSDMPTNSKVFIFRDTIWGTIRFFDDVISFLNENFKDFLDNKIFDHSRLKTINLSDCDDFRVVIQNMLIHGMDAFNNYCGQYKEGRFSVPDSNIDLQRLLGDRLYNQGFKPRFDVTTKGDASRTCANRISLRANAYMGSNSEFGDIITLV